MAKMTLLEMTQNILSAMSSDEVNSITDTVESQQVAEEIRNTFYELYSNRDIAEQQSLLNLEFPGDTDKPNQLKLPDNVDRIKWIKYLNYRSGNTPGYQEVEYMDPEEFIQRIVEQGTSNYGVYETVKLTDTSPIEYTINAGKAPDYYTILDDDTTLIFDSYDVLYESHLTGANSLAWGYLSPEFQMTDDFVAPIDAHLFPHFLAEAKAVSFINVKEVANSKEEQRARRQLVRSQYRTDKTNGQRRGILNGIDYSKRRR